MRILLVNKFYWNKGGSERVYFDLAHGYEAAGHDVVPFAMASARNRPSPYERYFVPETTWEGGAWSRLRAAANVVYSREAARCLRALLRDTRPDVAHLHNFHHQLSPSIVDVLRREGVPAVHTLHDYKVICPNYLLYTKGAVCERCRGGRFHHAVVHRCLRDGLAPSLVAFAEMTWHGARRTLERGVRRVISPSRFLRDKLVEFGFPTERVRVVPNGLDVSAFAVAKEAGSGFLYAGRLSREKGIRTLIEAVGRARGTRLTICGAGPEEAAVRDLAARTAPARVEFAGYLDRGELLERVRGARAVVLPSEWYENAPVAALEALASGVPVIASRIGGNPEIVRDGESGLLFRPGSADELAERIERLGRDPALAARLGAAGRRLVETEFALSDQVDQMLAILEEVSSSASR